MQSITFESAPGYMFLLTMKTWEIGFPKLLDLTSFLCDFNKAYELCRVALDPKYQNDFPSKHEDLDSYRETPLEKEDMLRVLFLTVHSPLEIITAVPLVAAGIGALFAALQLIDKAAKLRRERMNLQLDNKLKELEIKKLAAELEKLEENSVPILAKGEAKLVLTTPVVDNQTKAHLESLEKRFADSPIILRDFKFDYKQGPLIGEKLAGDLGKAEAFVKAVISQAQEGR